MTRNIFSIFLILLFTVFFLAACGNEEKDDGFQNNRPEEFKVLEIFKDEGSLGEAWNEIDGVNVSLKFNDLVNVDKEAFRINSFCLGKLLTHESGVVQTISGIETSPILKRLMNPGKIYYEKNNINSFYSRKDINYTSGFFKALDTFAIDYSDEDKVKFVTTGEKILKYYLDNFKQENVRDDVQSLIDVVNKPKFNKKFTDLAKVIGKFTVQTDYPIWISNNKPLNKIEINPVIHTNTKLGNVVRGNVSLLSGLNKLTIKPETNKIIQNLINDSTSLFDPDKESKNADIIKDLICNIEKYLTKDGEEYKKDGSVYKKTDNDEIYSDAELKSNILDILPFITQYVVRADRETAMINDVDNKKEYPLALLAKSLNYIGWDPEKSRIEESVYDTLRYDLYGRDRIYDPKASHLSFLENLLFISSVSSNIGYTHIEHSDNPEFSENYTDENQVTGGNMNAGYQHGHLNGADALTLNDALLSLSSIKKDLFGGLGTYDLTFVQSDQDQLFRSHTPFSTANRNDYKFYYDHNYMVGRFVSGNPGDLGDPDGGVNPKDKNGNFIKNGYRPYNPSGLREDNIALNTMGGSLRASWYNEGPYFYAPSNAPTINFKGKTWNVYYAPDRRVYAYVYKPDENNPKTWQYNYPSQHEGQGMEKFAHLRVKYTEDSITTSEELVINIKIDDNINTNVTFTAKIWSIEEVVKKISDAIDAEGAAGSDYIKQYNNSFKISGKSSNPEISKIEITNVNNENGVELFFKGFSGDGLFYYLSRFDRFAGYLNTDYFLTKVGANDYISMAHDKNGDLTCVELEEGDNARSVLIEQTIKADDPKRLCSSFEEAIFRNYQFFFAERKFVLVIPLYLKLHSLSLQIGGIYKVIEANGYAGLAYARKLRANHIWVKKNSNGPSDIPGDYRFEIVGKTSILDAEEIYSHNIGNGTSFKAILPHNLACIYRLGFPRAPLIDHGLDVNGKPIKDYLLGSQDFEVGDDIWNKRNSLLIVLQAFWGSLHSHTKLGYEAYRSGTLNFFDLVINMLKPVFYYQKDNGSYPHKAWKPRLVDDHWFLKPSADFYINSPSTNEIGWSGSEEEQNYYRAAKIKTIITMLIDQDPYKEPSLGKYSRCNGLLPMLTGIDEDNYDNPGSRTLTNVFKLLVELGGVSYNDPVQPDFVNFDEDMRNWGVRRRIFYGLEQIVSSIKFTKGEHTRIDEGIASDDSKYHNYGSYKKRKFPEYIFAKGIDSSKDVYGEYTEYENVRDDDFILDYGLDLLIGNDKVDDDNEGYGLTGFLENKDINNPEDWKSYYDLMDFLEAVLHKDSEYSTTADIINSSLKYNKEYSIEKLTGLLYALGKQFVYYDDAQSKYIYQGSENFDQLFNIVKNHLPQVHEILKDNTGKNYYSMLKVVKAASKKDGVVETALNSVSTSANFEKVFLDLLLFTEKDVVRKKDPMWVTLTTLLNELAKAMANSDVSGSLDTIYDKFGFQKN
ncbi:MAG: hypothetical protein GY714_11090 [Desulfobacterales bacterium]|nr:hypothetical protein [Desulfobacterales bacterium]